MSSRYDSRDSPRSRGRDRPDSRQERSQRRSSNQQGQSNRNSPTSADSLDPARDTDVAKRMEDASPLDVRAARKVWECDVADVLNRLEAVECICVKRRSEEDKDGHLASAVRQKDYESVNLAIENAAILLTGSHRSLMNVWRIAKHLPERRAKAKRLYQKWTEGIDQLKDAITRLGHKNGVPDWGRLDDVTRIKIFDMWESCRDNQMEARVPWQETLGMEDLMLAVLCHSRAQPEASAAMLEAKFAAAQEGFTTGKLVPTRTGAAITAQRTGVPVIGQATGMLPHMTGVMPPAGVPYQQTGMMPHATGQMMTQMTGMPNMVGSPSPQHQGAGPNYFSPVSSPPPPSSNHFNQASISNLSLHSQDTAMRQQPISSHMPDQRTNIMMSEGNRSQSFTNSNGHGTGPVRDYGTASPAAQDYGSHITPDAIGQMMQRNRSQALEHSRSNSSTGYATDRMRAPSSGYHNNDFDQRYPSMT